MIGELMTCMLFLCHPIVIKGHCEKSWWAPNVLKDDRHLLFVSHSKRFEFSLQSCEYLGGQLVILHNSDEEHLIKKWVSALPAGCDAKFHLGLSNLNTDQYHWVDDTVLDKSRYSYWKAGHPLKVQEYCVSMSIHNCQVGNLVSGPCRANFNYVCEATVPCSSRPVISIGDSGRLENETATVPLGRLAKIQCWLRGYFKGVKMITLICDGNLQRSSEPWTQLITSNINITLKMHGKKCCCKSSLSSGKKDETRITLSVQTRPLLSNESHNFRTISAEEGESATVSFYMYANPIPKSYQLTYEGLALKSRWYKMSVTALKKAIRSKVTVTMKNLNTERSGTYIMTISNGIENDLDYVFNLKVKESNKMSNSTKSKIFTGSVIFVTLTSMIIVFIITERRRKKDLQAKKDLFTLYREMAVRNNALEKNQSAVPKNRA